MAASVIPILLDSSEGSVGSHVPIVPVDPLVAPEVGAVSVTSPIGVLDLVDYSSSDSDPSEASLPLAPDLPLVLPFLYSDDSEADSESKPIEQRPERHESLFVHDDMVSRSTSLSTPYPPTTSESSPDSSFEISLDSSLLSVGPSRKRCRSPTTSVPSSTPVLRLIAPTLADLLPPRKRFKDSYSLEDKREEHMQIGIADAKAVTDLGIDDGVGVDTEDVIDLLVTGGISEFARGDAPDLEGTLHDMVHYMSEVPLDRITKFETAQRQLEAGQLIASRERAGLADRIRRLGQENLRVRALLCIERDRVDSLHHYMTLSHDEFCQIRRDRDDARMRLRRLESLVERRLGFRPYFGSIIVIQNGNDGDNDNGGNGNENHEGRGNNENGNPNENGRGAMPVARVCTYQDFMKCQPLNFKGTEGVVDSALTWWNSHKRTVRVDVVFVMTWRDLMKLMMKEYCPRNEIHKMETELMVPKEEDRIERYVGGLPDNIEGNVMSAEPTRLHDAIRLANSLMDQKLKGYAIRSDENKRKFKSNQRDNRA
uniref:Retrotransposon gag domain-containing protein n=1 Tax=Tanacetum cinerariifolium TaxID=118510 RepID=A0A6L2MMH6_TANCI|nr:hypothetical protein [Tanacetum cinerariifolium]